MSHRTRPTLRPPRPATTHARILGVGGYRPARVVTNAEIVERIDSTDEWIRERSGIVDAGTRPRPTRPSSTWPSPPPSKALANAGVDRRPARLRHRRHRHPPVADPVRRRRRSPTALGAEQGGGVRHLGRLRRLLPRRSRWPTTWCAAAPPSTSSWSASRSSPTWSTRTTAAPRSSSATARARPSSVGPSTPGIGPVVWGSDGEPVRRLITQTESWHDPARTTPGHKFPTLAMNGQPVFRWAVVPDGAGLRSRRSTAAGITADDLDAFIPHQANLRIIDAMVKKLELPEQRGRRPRHRRHRQHLGGLDPARDGAACSTSGEAPQRRPRAAHRVRCRPGLRRPGRGRLPRDPHRIARRADSLRRTVRARGRHHRPEGAPSMATQQEILAGLAEIVNEVAGIPVDDVQLDKSFIDDLDIDSLSMVEVVVAAEEKFGVKIPDDDVKNLRPSATPSPTSRRPAPEPRRDPSSTSQPARRRNDRRGRADRPDRPSWSPGSGASTPLGGDVADDLGRHAGRALRRPAADRGVGRRPAGPVRRRGRRRPARGARPGRGPQARPLRAARADRGAGGVGRRRLAGGRPASGSASSSAPASAARSPCSTSTTPCARRARAGSPRTPSRC